MTTLFLTFALLAALLHVYIFCMESLWFMRPGIYKRFGAKSQEDAEAKRLWAFNQGYYNLFLAIGALAGIGIQLSNGHELISHTLILFACANMVGAGIVLIYSGGKPMLRAGTMQAFFPLCAWITWFIS
ncbi:DUF1304 domain-containing protein [Alteromonas facilis]|uniref:DUF1304 domain-containing protein n=1 Tax=Alteromonas facilis TaxID=2048004 RepID=UPI000C28EF8D|nr:DUF1304 domain-containing protein [Alteromonas facilis]